MTLQEIKSLPDEALGQSLIDLCGFEKDKEFSKLYVSGVYYFYPADLCRDMNVIAEVEKIVMQANPGGYGFWLVESFYDVELTVAVATAIISCCNTVRIATASARRRAEACLLALQEVG